MLTLLYLPGIHSLFVRLYKRMLVTIPSVASAMQIHCVHPVIVVTKESAEICVKKLPVVQEQDVIQENVYVLLDTLVHQTIQAKAATYMISVTSTKTVSHPRSVSKLHEDYENVLMDAVGSNVDQMHYVLRRSIVRRVFVVTDTLGIPVTLKLAARDIVQWIQKAANRTLTVRTDIFARSMLLAKEHASIHVKMLLAEPMKIVNWTKTAIQYASVKKVSYGIQYHLDVKNHLFRTA